MDEEVKEGTKRYKTVIILVIILSIFSLGFVVWKLVDEMNPSAVLFRSRLPPGGWKNIEWIDSYSGNWKEVDVSTKGIMPDSGDVSVPVQELIDSSEEPTILYFPAGAYQFGNSLDLKDNVIMKGEGPDETAFNFTGGDGALNFRGAEVGSEIAIVEDVAPGAKIIQVEDASNFSQGDLIEVAEDLESFEDWGQRGRGGVFKIMKIDPRANIITLDTPLAIGLDNVREKKATVQKIDPVENTGVQDLIIIRGRETNGSTINLDRAYNAFIKNVTSKKTSKHHIEISSSHNVVISDSFLDDAYNHGGGGYGYGILIGELSTNILVTNNILKNLRHEAVFQLGASYNIYSYNYHVDTFQDSCFGGSASPKCKLNSSQLNAQDIYYDSDIALHGHYPHHNLIEGNVIYYGGADYEHKDNGPKNIFFRNQIKGQPESISWMSNVGYFIDGPSHNQSVVGNDFLNNAYIKIGYSEAGKMPGFTFIGSNSVRGVAGYSGNSMGRIYERDDLEGYKTLPRSLYLNNRPDFWTRDFSWPAFGPGASNNTLYSGKIPAQVRYENMIQNTIPKQP
jgi:hypothetical protein